jgi:hypothetical protein
MGGTDYSDLNKLCKRMKDNDPTLVGEACTVPILRLPYLRRLSVALPTSTVVTSLSFDVTPYHYCIARYDLNPMLQYLREAKLIQSVEFISKYGCSPRPPNADEASRLIRAIADNAEMVLIHFSCHHVPLRVRDHHLIDLLQSKASSLQHVTLLYFGTQTWPALDMIAFADTVGSLSVLQSLTLGQLPNPELTALTLKQLRSHACLRKLSIVGYEVETDSGEADITTSPGIVEALSVMLQSSVPLEVLKMERVSISRVGMELLAPALEACPSLTELSWAGIFDCEAADSFVRCLRTSRTCTGSGLHRLCLGGDYQGPLPFTLILTGLEPGTAYMASSLQSLHLQYEFEEIGDLLRGLVMGHRLSSLSLYWLTDNSWSQLSLQLPNMLYLCKITIANLLQKQGRSRSMAMAFVHAMRKNGCLHKVSQVTGYVEYTSGPRCIQCGHRLFTATQLQQIRRYCERNRATRELLQNPNLCDGDDAHGGEAKTPLCLFPKLYEVMKPARRMAPNFILMGLLACDRRETSIRPRDRNKRLLVSRDEPAQESRPLETPCGHQTSE